jgi:hypothetical protein
MNRLALAAVLALPLLAGACAAHQEVAKQRMPWPAPPDPALLAFAPPQDRWPTIGGDILRGVSHSSSAPENTVRPLPDARPPAR